MRSYNEKVVDGPLAVLTTMYGDVAVVSLAGELDRATVATAESVLAKTVAAEHELLVVDLHDLEFLDSSGIAMLVGLSERVDRSGSLRIVPSPSREVTRILDLTGIGSMISIAGESPAAAGVGVVV